MKPTRLLALPALVALAFSFGAAQAQTPGTGTSATGGQSAPMAQPGSGTRNLPAKSQIARGDRKFIEAAAGSGMFEVQVAQLAAAKASDQNVKSFASMLVDHHTAANNELKAIAKRKNIDLPEIPTRSDHRGGVQSPGDATTELKTGTGKPTNPTGTTGAAGTVATTGQARDKALGAEPWMSQSGKAFDKGFVDDAVQDHQKAIELFENEAERGGDAQLKAFAKKTLPTLRDHLKQAQDLQQKLSTSTQ